MDKKSRCKGEPRNRNPGACRGLDRRQPETKRSRRHVKVDEVQGGAMIYPRGVSVLVRPRLNRFFSQIGMGMMSFLSVPVPSRMRSFKSRFLLCRNSFKT